MSFQSDKSGIHSLGGFSYQIKVFIYYAFKLRANEQIEFETIDDIAIKKISADNLDDESHCFLYRTNLQGIKKAIQVKRTKVSKEVAKQILLNWIMLERSDDKAEEYILFTEKEYKNKSDVLAYEVEDFYKDIITSKKRSDAAISKVKEIYSDKKQEFNDIYAQLQQKIIFRDIEDVEKEIESESEVHFKKVLNSVVYNQRLKELMKQLTYEILTAISNKESYVLNYKEFMRIIEHITLSYTPEHSIPSYHIFKRINDIDLEDMHIANKREYIQLKSCDLPKNLIKNSLLYGMYYSETRMKYMENNRIDKIDNIDETSFENFERVKFLLKKRNEDSPSARFEETNNKSNSYAENEQIKYGSLIYLTKEGIGEKQISWKDDDNG